MYEILLSVKKKKNNIMKLRNLKSKLDEARGELENAQREYDFNKAAELNME